MDEHWKVLFRGQFVSASSFAFYAVLCCFVVFFVVFLQNSCHTPVKDFSWRYVTILAVVQLLACLSARQLYSSFKDASLKLAHLLQVPE